MAGAYNQNIIKFLKENADENDRFYVCLLYTSTFVVPPCFAAPLQAQPFAGHRTRRSAVTGAPVAGSIFTCAAPRPSSASRGLPGSILRACLLYTSMKLVSAIIVAIAISMPAIKKKIAFEQRKHGACRRVTTGKEEK